MKKHLMLARIFAFVLLVLEAMPSGAVMYFMTDTERIRYTFSYFDPVTYGNADFGPFLTACLTVVLAVLLVIAFFIEKRYLYVSASVISVVASVLSLLPVLFGLEWMSAISWCISVVFICESVLLCIYVRNSEK